MPLRSVHANLLRNFVSSQPNQAWVAYITYMRLADEFVYLAVLPDAYSRLVIGWSLERTVEAKLAVAAMRMALSRREVPQGLIHHSDRGVRYACADYKKILKDRQIRISMSRKRNPYDNARAESFTKTLKHEQVHHGDYRNIGDARRRIGAFLETTYGKQRLHCKR